MNKNQVGLLGFGLVVKAYSAVKSFLGKPGVKIGVIAAALMVIGQVTGLCDGTQLVTYDGATGALSFNWGLLITPLINSVVGAVTLGVPLLLLSMVIRACLRMFGLFGAKK